jgi:hypothetical protein
MAIIGFDTVVVLVWVVVDIDVDVAGFESQPPAIIIAIVKINIKKIDLIKIPLWQL